MKQLSERKPAFVDGDLPVREAIVMMKGRDEPCLLVGTAGETSGILTERDLLKRVATRGDEVLKQTVSELMTPNPTVLSMDHSIGDALEAMAAGGYRHLPITEEDDDGNPVVSRVVSVTDIVDLLVIHFPDAILNPWFDIKPGDNYG